MQSPQKLCPQIVCTTGSRGQCGWIKSTGIWSSVPVCVHILEVLNWRERRAYVSNFSTSELSTTGLVVAILGNITCHNRCAHPITPPLLMVKRRDANFPRIKCKLKTCFWRPNSQHVVTLLDKTILITSRQIIKLRRLSHSLSSYLLFRKSSTWRVFFDKRWKLALSSRSLRFFVELFMTIQWCQRLLTASTAGNMRMAWASGCQLFYTTIFWSVGCRQFLHWSSQ